MLLRNSNRAVLYCLRSCWLCRTGMTSDIYSLAILDSWIDLFCLILNDRYDMNTYSLYIIMDKDLL